MSRDGYGPVADDDEGVVDIQPRCECGSLLAEFLSRPWTIKCRRCKKVVRMGHVPRWIEEHPQLLGRL